MNSGSSFDVLTHAADARHILYVLSLVYIGRKLQAQTRREVLVDE